jgi:hypothetical protein
VTIRATARLIDRAAGELAAKGRGFLGRREHYVEQVIGEFVDQAFCVPPGGPLAPEIREELKLLIDHTIDLLEIHVSRCAQRSPRQAAQHLGVVRQIYALREVEEHLTQTHRWYGH